MRSTGRAAHVGAWPPSRRTFASAGVEKEPRDNVLRSPNQPALFPPTTAAAAATSPAGALAERGGEHPAARAIPMATAAAFTAVAVGATRLPVASAGPARSSPVPFLQSLPSPRRQGLSSSLSLETRRFSQVVVKASSSEETSGSLQVDDLFTDLKEKWDGLENKSTVFIYGGGAIVAVWLSSVVIGAINSVPLLPKLMELVGLGYTGWFVYRYLLFKSSRKELVSDIEALKKKIAGTE